MCNRDMTLVLWYPEALSVLQIRLYSTSADFTRICPQTAWAAPTPPPPPRLPPFSAMMGLQQGMKTHPEGTILAKLTRHPSW